MSLAIQKWTPVSVHLMVSVFLRGERRYFTPGPGATLAPIDTPDLASAAENHHRLRWLYQRRAHLLGEIPPDTQWYLVQNLTDDSLDELHAIARCGWDDPADKNEIRRVATRRPEALTDSPNEWAPPILWGHDKGGPFTILEGNHRVTAYASTAKPPGLAIAVLIGVSPMPCFWHIFDPPWIIANDLWKR